MAPPTAEEIAQQTYTPDDNARASTSTSTSSSLPSSSSTADWTSNPHISFNRSTSRWIYEDPSSGKEYEFDEGTRAWREVLDDDDVGRQQDAYGEGDDEDAQEALRRKRDDVKKRKRGGEGPSENKPRANASLFISSLPLDATVDEVAEVFSRYGIIAEDDEGNPRIKMYHVDGMFKGEALLSFFKPESCTLAIQLLDGTCLREALGQREPLMKVEMADWSRSVQQPQEAPQEPSKKTRTEAEKKRAAKRFARMNDKLTGWESDSETETANSIRQSIADSNTPGPTLLPPTHPSFPKSSARTILLKHLFTPSEITSEPELLLEIKDDIREECAQFGAVTNVVLYDLEQDGLVSVRFAKNGGEQAAKSAVKKMHGRWFAGRAVEAFLVEGRVRYKRSGKGGVEDGEDKDGFGEWLRDGGEEE